MPTIDRTDRLLPVHELDGPKQTGNVHAQVGINSGAQIGHVIAQVGILTCTQVGNSITQTGFTVTLIPLLNTQYGILEAKNCTAHNSYYQ